MFRFLCLLVAGLAITSSPIGFGAVRAHNVYTSFNQIDWNASDNSIELVVQIHGHELETKLSLLLDRRLSFLEEADLPALEMATGQFLIDHIRLSIDEQPVELIFLGIESDGQTVTAYLEQDWPQAPQTIRFMNSIFLEDLPGQVNSVLVTVDGTRQGGDISLESKVLAFKF